MKRWVGALGYLIAAALAGLMIYLWAGARADYKALEAQDEGRRQRVEALTVEVTEARAEARAHKARADEIQARSQKALEEADKAVQALRQRVRERKPPQTVKECEQSLGECDQHAESLAKGFELEKATRLAVEAAYTECDRGLGLCMEALELQGDRADYWKRHTRKAIRKQRWRAAGWGLIGGAVGFGAGAATMAVVRR